MKVLSVNVSLPREVPWKGKVIRTGIYKEPVAGRVRIRRLNLDGDRQADLRVHGGPEKAVYAYPSEYYELWRRERPDLDFPWGTRSPTARAGNAVAAYSRSSDGSLTPAGAIATGGLGTGSGLESQGAVVVTKDGQTVLAVNPGSNTVSALVVEADGLRLLGSAPSGGIGPVSVTVHNGLVYVLNRNNAVPATVSALRLSRDGLTPIPGSTRELYAGATDAAQVQFAPDGSTLVVTGRSSNRIDTFRIGSDGLASDLKSFDAAPGALPFGFDFDNKGHLLVSLAGVGSSSGAASYAVAEDGTVSTITAPIETGERDACWLVASNDGRFAFVANAASRSISTFAVAPDGSLGHLSAQPVAGTTALDEALSRDDRFLYVLSGDSIVGYEIGADGSLKPIARTSAATTAAGLAVC